jgi:hypothetical protein
MHGSRWNRLIPTLARWCFRHLTTGATGFVLLVGATLLRAADPEPSAIAFEPKSFDQKVQPFVTKHCVECHRGDKPKGDLRLDRLTNAFDSPTSRKSWQTIRDRVAAGEMPPEERPRPTVDEIKALLEWIDAGVQDGVRRERAIQGRVVFRRLNRVEYQNTIRDLLGVNIDVKDMLPVDSAADGFDNVGDALHVSSFLMEKYLEAADAALNIAISNRPKPPPLISKKYSLKETHQVRATTEKVFRKSEGDAVVMFSSSAWQSVSITPFYPPDRGRYRFRISASGVQSAGKPITYRIDAGKMEMTGRPHLVGYFDAPAEKSNVVEFLDDLEPRSTIRISPYGLAGAQVVDKVGADAYDGPGLSVDWVEVEGPLHDAWPPASHRRIFGDLAQGTFPEFNNRDRVEVTSKDPAHDAERILRAFASRAFRRTITDEDVKPYIALVEAKLAEKRTFEQAVRAGLTAILVAPDFLFLRESPGPLDDFALANRLSYFLWSSMPDDELLKLAAEGKLTGASANSAGKSSVDDASVSPVLRAQVDRMLKDPRASAFTENFVGQWLGLRDIDFTLPSHILYPDYDEMLKASMLKEAELFFAELLKDDLSLTNFLASDFTMLNGRLAKHYGIPDVDGWEFRKTKLPEGSHRGGVLTMAAVMKVTANGTSTSPVTRGAWVLERILGTPPPKPPENIAALEPDTRGATTIREQLAKHRQIETCATCHRLIDPPGFALESFDVIGGYREHYRTHGNGKPVFIDGRRMIYLEGKAIDPSDTLLDGRRFANVDEFKRLLLDDREQFARALTTKLVTYATGGPPEPSDRPQIDAIVKAVDAKGNGFRTLIHEIVQSDLFRSK